MAEQKIEFRKIRDFGEVINDTFVFLRQNLKPLLKVFFAICGAFMLAQAIVSGLYQSHTLIKVQQLTNRSPTSFSNLGNMYASIFNVEYFLLLIIVMLSIVAVKTVVGAYIKFYVENDGRIPGIDDIWRIFKQYYFKLFVYDIPLYLLVIGGCIFCLLPGIYFWVVLVPFNMVVMIEDKGFGESFNRCFEIIKENFWSSFGVYIISAIIYGMCAWVITFSVEQAFGLSSYLTTSDNTEIISIVKSFLSVFSFTFYIIYFIAAALQYFSLAEQKDGTGILNRIDTIGSGPHNFDNTEEQY